ncbi:unnamed protein product [Brassica oleracea]|uniref:(rape) hypothetical protein n=1 Tax=Brassica napus TaxID=3708 RepID=A0A816MB81_BRANA|nr:unnamed protein product [Brassica napus]
MKPNGKSPITSDYDAKVMFFRDVSPGPHETQLRFRLIHFWEAWNPLKKTLIGLEMLLIDEHGFISPGRIERYLPKMKPGLVYRLNNFYGSSNKSVYRVFDHAVTVSLSWNSELSVLEDNPTPFDEDRFRFHSFEDFQANCDRKGDLYVLCVSVLCGHEIVDYLFLLFLLTHLMNNGIDVVGHMKLVNGQSIIETPVLDEVEIARARHVLVHVQSHELGPNPQSAEWVNAEVVTKRETLTIGEIYSYIKQGSTKEAFFECTATIDDVVHGSTWYYISCSSYHTKATKGPTSLMCSKCGKVNIAGVAQYRAQIFVYDNSEQAVFVLLGDAGYDTICQKHNFCVKVTKHNLEGKSRSLTVTKILPLDTPAATEYSEETFETGINVCEASKVSVDSAEGIKRTCCIDEMGKAKCLKGGN